MLMLIICQSIKNFEVEALTSRLPLFFCTLMERLSIVKYYQDIIKGAAIKRKYVKNERYSI